MKQTGDGTVASFASAVAAVTAALQLQRDLAPGLPAKEIFRG